MDEWEILEYTHKIVKITLTNNNTIATYPKATIKIHLEKEQNETIRFSKVEKPQRGHDDWLEHQSNGDDYFLRVDSIPSVTTYIYAHFFPASLYNYVESQEIFSIYDFADFFKDNPTDKYFNEEYPLQIRSYGYEMMLGNENKPYIRSILDKSLTKYKDPNYKQYIKGDNENDTLHMTEQGRFPLSSRYRNSRYGIAPDFDKDILPHWQSKEAQYSYSNNPTITSTVYNKDTYTYNNINSLNDNNLYNNASACNKRQDLVPFWEAKIHRRGLSPLDTETETFLLNESNAEDTTSETKDTPINVFLNYQYLPTSTEYHQHYFGFEGRNTYKNDVKVSSDLLPEVTRGYDSQNNYNKLHAYCNNIKNGTYNQLTQAKNFEILEGEGLDYINKQFGQSTTYRLINHGNPFDDRHTMSVKHENIIDLNLSDDKKMAQNCTWERNKCQKYWTLTPLAENGEDSIVYFDKKLKADTPYVLKYYMYIPAQAYVEDSSELRNYETMNEEAEMAADSCYVIVQNMVNGQAQTIGKLDKAFRRQDKKLRHQWIYHEIPFFTLEADTRIIIKGPKHSVNQCYTYNKDNGKVTIKDNFTSEDKASTELELHDCRNDVIHFYSIQIAEMVEYSPTIKYTNNGLYIVEEGEHLDEKGKMVRGGQYAQKPLSDVKKNNCTETPLSTNDIPKWENKNNLPIPSTDIYISFAGDFEIHFNELTTEITWTTGFDFNFKDYSQTFDVTLAWESLTDSIKLQYPELLENLTEAEYQSKKYEEECDGSIHKDRTHDLDNNIYQGRWSLYREHFTTFTNGINNEFTLKLQDAYGNPITNGTVECAIFNAKDEQADCADALKCLSTKQPNEYGEIKYQNLNFRAFKVTSDTNKYWLRIKYENPCYPDTIIKWKELIFIQEHANMIVFANRCLNNGFNTKVCNSLNDITNNNNCCKYCTSSYYDNETDEYQSTFIIKNTSHINVNGPKQYNIQTVEELPLRLDVMIRSEPTNEHPEGNILNEGYCELSINDKIIQTTYVDDNGIADFYLDSNDLPAGINVVKIEYFKQKNYETTNFAYFVIYCNPNTYDTREAVPITIRTIYDSVENINEQTQDNTYRIKDINDLLLIDVATEEHSNFSITIQKYDDTTKRYKTTDVKNIYDDSNIDMIAIEKSDNDKINNYKIITDNIAVYNKDENSWTYKDGKYRRNQKIITVYWGV